MTSRQRMTSAPDVPTVSETVIPGYEATFGEILLAPRGTPEQSIARLNKELAAALRTKGRSRPHADRGTRVRSEFAHRGNAAIAARVRKMAAGYRKNRTPSRLAPSIVSVAQQLVASRSTQSRELPNPHVSA